MVPSVRQETFACVGERQVTDIVAQRRHSQHLSPIRQLLRTSEWRQQISNLIREIVRVCYDVKDTISELHDAKRVFESLVRSPQGTPDK